LSLIGRWGGAFAICIALGLIGASRSWGLFLDMGRHFKVTGQFYTQQRLRMQDSDGPEDLEGGGTQPKVQIGHLIQWRNFAFPVFEGNLNKPLALTWLDDLSFRFAGRFIYDGVYDIGADQFRRELRRHKVSAASRSPNAGAAPGGDPHPGPGLGGNEPVAIYRGTRRVEINERTRIGACGPAPAILVLPSPITCQLANPEQRAARLRDQEIFDPRNLFTQQYEPWEIYMNVERRPFFLRIGRQNLAWGESDGQRLLDGNNPLDRLFGLPFDEDLDEQRIPLWMVRTNVQLIDTWGPLSSFGVESYVVPGIIDTTQGPVPLGADYPYAPPAGCDPQFIANERSQAEFGGSRPPNEGCTRSRPGLIKRGTIKTSLYERLPEKKWENSRYGIRVLGILFRDYTFSVGAYRSWADVPEPRVHYTDLLMSDPALPPDSPAQTTPPLPTAVIAELTHGTVTVVGGAVSFFQPRLVPGVVRSEIGYFIDEPALVPIANIGNIPNLENFARGQGVFLDTFVPTADYLRWVVGYDMFQVNVPWISATNNIVIVAQWFNSYRLTSDAKYRRLVRQLSAPGAELDPDLGKFDFGITQPDGSRTSSPAYQSLGNVTFQAYMMHGRLVPQITFVGDIEGWGSVLPNVTYRFSDSLLLRLSYSTIFGSFFGGGIFRDRDQVGMRLTYQFN
jgi:hypothetical protein